MESTTQLLNSGILEGNFEDNLDTSWIFNQVHSVQDQSHIKTWHGGHLPNVGQPVNNRCVCELVDLEKYPMSESIHVHTLDIRSHMDKSGQ